MKKFDVTTAVSLMPKEQKQALGAGFGTFNNEKGNIDFANDKDKKAHDNYVKKLVLLSHASKSNPTDMMKRVTAIANSGSVAGVNFEAQIKDDAGMISQLPADDINVVKAREVIVKQFGVSLEGLANGGIKVLGVKK